MRKTLPLILLGIVLLFPSALSAATQELSPQELWAQAGVALRDGDRPEAENLVGQIQQVGRSVGVRRFPAYADAVAALALQRSRSNDQANAEWMLALASTLDPRLPDVDFTAADMAYARSDWNGAGRALLAGFSKTGANYRTRLLAISDLTLVACAAFALTALAFALLLFYRYSRAAAHDFCELLSTKMRQRTATVLGWALLFAPLFLWLGPSWLILYWMGLFFGYATKRERTFIVLFVLAIGLLPLLLAWTSFRISGIDSPVIQAAVANAEDSLNPEPLRRLEQLAEIMPDEPVLSLLMGDLEVQQANERAAAQHYRQAIEKGDRIAGAHLNLGNLYFFENDFQTASLEYERAAQMDPSMAIAYYNQSVASGELYKFTEQGEQLAQARDRDRTRIARLLATPPRTKVVMYQLPVGNAWGLAERIARSGDAREIYGNHALFEPAQTMKNPLTLAAFLALALAAILWRARRENGFAAECIKCGRTFCHRCKASKESASYCTQCIHIYLKRDGVSLETKRDKIQEVQEYQTSSMRRKKALSFIAPGAGQIIDDKTIRGLVLFFLFIFAVGLAVLIGNLAPLAAPAVAMKLSVRALAVALAILIWLVAFIPVLRQRASA